MNEERTVTCADCGAPMKLKQSRYGPFYGCARWPSCRGTHGAHPDGRPLGTPADKVTKEARMAAHACFDRLWKSGRMRRTAAYGWLAEQLGLSREDCHIGHFSREQCERVVEVVSLAFRFEPKKEVTT